MAQKHSNSDSDLPGIKTQYNHDLNVSGEFLCDFSMIRDALEDQRLLNEFRRYEGLAKSQKVWFQTLGLLSLLLGLLSLGAAAFQIILGDSLAGEFPVIWRAANVAAFASLFLIVWMRVGGYRRRWCLAVFCRERLRQWHFQKFLDGELMGKIVTDRNQYDSQLNEKWNELQQNLRDGFGMMQDFMASRSRQNDFFFEYKPYPISSALGQTVLRALRTLRLDHQLRYTRRKEEVHGEGTGMALREHDSIAETVASVTLGGAVLVNALTVVFASRVNLSRALNGGALLLTVLSAASRAYRSGLTVPEEAESYSEYGDAVRQAKAIFDYTDFQGQFLQLQRVEEESAAELRRFLKMKIHANFIF